MPCLSIPEYQALHSIIDMLLLLILLLLLLLPLLLLLLLYLHLRLQAPLEAALSELLGKKSKLAPLLAEVYVCQVALSLSLLSLVSLS